MSMDDTFRNDLCSDFTARVDALSLHLGDPGVTGANDSAVPHVTPLVWTTPVDGLSYATVVFNSLSGDFTHAGLWGSADTVFLMGVLCPIHFTAAADVTVLVTHQVDQDVFTIAVG